MSDLVGNINERVPSEAPVLMSACLLGEPCRYDGKAVQCEAALEFARKHEVVPICPEQLGGLSTPRSPSERQADGHVLNNQGEDVTAAFYAGAQSAALIARERKCMTAILKSKSPSCGVHQIYDGSFTGTVIAGKGLAAEALESAGLQLIDETEIGITH